MTHAFPTRRSSELVVAFLRRPASAERPGDMEMAAVAARDCAADFDDERVDTRVVIGFADDARLGFGGQRRVRVGAEAEGDMIGGATFIERRATREQTVEFFGADFPDRKRTRREPRQEA